MLEVITSLDATTTVIMIAHDLETLRHCDKVFELEDGILKLLESLVRRDRRYL